MEELQTSSYTQQHRANGNRTKNSDRQIIEAALDDYVTHWNNNDMDSSLNPEYQ